MITHDTRRSLPRGNNPVPSPWLATTGDLGRRGLDEIRLSANQSRDAMHRASRGFVTLSAFRDMEAAQVAITQASVVRRSALDTSDIARRPVRRDST
jgi:hypothetical protein